MRSKKGRKKKEEVVFMAAYAPTTHNVRQDIYSSIYTYIYIY